MRSNVLKQVNDSGGVAVLVIVPGNQLDEFWRQQDTGAGIKDGRSGVGQEVGGDNLVFGVAENTLQWAFRSLFDSGLDFVVSDFFLQLDGQVDNGNVDGWDSQSHTGQLTVQFRDDLTDGLSSAGGGWDNVARSGSTASPVLVGWAVNRFLGSGDGVHGGHQAFFNAKVVVDDLGQWGQAVCGAGSVGNDLFAIVFFFIDTNNKHWGIFGWGGDNDLLGTTVNVLLGTVQVLEDTGGVDNNVDAVCAPWDVGWVSFLENENVLAIDGQGCTVRGNLARVSAVGGVVLEHVSSVLGRNEWVIDGNDLDVFSLQSNSEDKTANTSETVDTDGDHCG